MAFRPIRTIKEEFIDEEMASPHDDPNNRSDDDENPNDESTDDDDPKDGAC